MRCTPYLLADDGLIPNHPALPLLVYEGGLSLARPDPAAIAEETFRRNGWGGTWRNGIYPFHGSGSGLTDEGNAQPVVTMDEEFQGKLVKIVGLGKRKGFAYETSQTLA